MGLTPSKSLDYLSLSRVTHDNHLVHTTKDFYALTISKFAKNTNLTGPYEKLSYHFVITQLIKCVYANTWESI